MESALPVTLCYMLADLKAKTAQHCHVVSLPYPSVSASDFPIIDCCTAQKISKQCEAWVKEQYCQGKYDVEILLHVLYGFVINTDELWFYW